MRALVFEQFRGPLGVTTVPDPDPAPLGVVVEVQASGICRSDWHGWQGHDADVHVPHVPGHELAGTVSAVGSGVRRWRVGDRVTVPFVNACGRCAVCSRGEQQVCPWQTQPGFTHWGSLAQFVALEAADVNLVGLPEDLACDVAASLGCRFATAFRAVVQQAKVRPGEWLAVHGCGGLGLSVVLIAVAAGARVVAVDVSPDAAAMAGRLGAEVVVDRDPVSQIREVTGGGASVSVDAAGTAATCVNSVSCLAPRGRHIQAGLLLHGQPELPMGLVISRELTVLGSHGMAAHAYPELLGLVSAGRLQPEKLISHRISLGEAGAALAAMGARPGITVVTRFD